MKTFYFKRNNGELYQDSWHDTPEAVLNELVPGYERITRREYRELKREAKRIQDKTDWFEVAKKAEQASQPESEFKKKFESDRFYFGESGMSGE